MLSVRPGFSYEMKQLTDGRQVLALIDLCQPNVISLTNGMETALKEVEQKSGLPALIIYRDSEGRWDQVLVENGVVGFRGIGVQNIDLALEILKSR